MPPLTCAADKSARQNHPLESVEQAIHEGDLRVFHQPILDNQTGQVSQEALMRLATPRGTFLLPDQFLEVAQRLGAYAHFERQMIQQVCRVFSGTSERFSFNLFVRDILDTQFRHFVLQQLHEHALNKQATLEILEWDDTDNYAMFYQAIHEFRQAGVTISLDDFFTGFSNYRRFFRLWHAGGGAGVPVNEIKIDRSHIAGISRNSLLRREVSGFLENFSGLGLEFVAEGVETLYDQMRVVRLGIHKTQGFLVGKPQAKMLDERLNFCDFSLLQ